MPLPIKGRERGGQFRKAAGRCRKTAAQFARHALMIAYFLATKTPQQGMPGATRHAGVGSQPILIYAGIRPLASEHQHGLRKPLEPSARCVSEEIGGAVFPKNILRDEDLVAGGCRA